MPQRRIVSLTSSQFLIDIVSASAYPETCEQYSWDSTSTVHCGKAADKQSSTQFYNASCALLDVLTELVKSFPLHTCNCNVRSKIIVY